MRQVIFDDDPAEVIGSVTTINMVGGFQIAPAVFPFHSIAPNFSYYIRITLSRTAAPANPTVYDVMLQ
jgi:hypothetical protein